VDLGQWDPSGAAYDRTTDGRPDASDFPA